MSPMMMVTLSDICRLAWTCSSLLGKQLGSQKQNLDLKAALPRWEYHSEAWFDDNIMVGINVSVKQHICDKKGGVKASQDIIDDMSWWVLYFNLYLKGNEIRINWETYWRGGEYVSLEI